MAAVASDAATMLAEALQKMDGLISDDQLIMESLKSQPHTFITTNERILSLVEELRAHLEELSHEVKSTIDVPESTVAFLSDWLESMQVIEKKGILESKSLLSYCLLFHGYRKVVLISALDNV